MTQPTGHFPELREFVKECEQKLYDFCFYMLAGHKAIDEVVLSIFREFGDYYRGVALKQPESAGVPELRIALFRLAWRQIRELSVAHPHTWTLGRDTRLLKSWDTNLLAATAERTSLEWKEAVTERFRLLDPDFRGSVVLKDVLRFEDEEAVRVLGIRWGVFRHRLHRGRLDFRECLVGTRTPTDSPPLGQTIPVRT